MVQHPLYETMVMAVIIVNCILLALDDATVKPGSRLRAVLDASDYAFAAFFTVEMLMKVFAWGVWKCGHTYVGGADTAVGVRSHEARCDACDCNSADRLSRERRV